MHSDLVALLPCFDSQLNSRIGLLFRYAYDIYAVSSDDFRKFCFEVGPFAIDDRFGKKRCLGVRLFVNVREARVSWVYGLSGWIVRLPD